MSDVDHAMSRRVVVVGPVFPFKGGIAQHTAAMANALAEAGHDVIIENWKRQYPRRLYPGQLTIDQPEVEIHVPVRRRLSWNRPDSWFRVGRASQRADAVIIAHVNPWQAIAYIAALAGRRSRSGARLIVAHNVLPHERSKVDRILVKLLFNRAGRVMTHSPAEQQRATSVTKRPVVMAHIAPFMPSGFVAGTPAPGEHRRLLFFGLVRPYKGLDVLLGAIARGPKDVKLRVAGEFWGGRQATDQLIHELGLGNRVEIVDRYIGADEVGGQFSDVDALVLPYRSATGSQAVWTAFQFGVPAIATTAGRLADDIRVGVDGLTAIPDDVASLAAAINDFYQPGRPEAMRAEVRPVDPAPYWREYLSKLLDDLPPLREG